MNSPSKAIKLLLGATLSLNLVACGGPSDEVLAWGIKEKHPAMKYGLYTLGSVKRTNEFSRTIDGEKVYFVEYEAQANSRGGQSEVLDETAGFVERGKNWYLYNE